MFQGPDYWIFPLSKVGVDFNGFRTNKMKVKDVEFRSEVPFELILLPLRRSFVVNPLAGEVLMEVQGEEVPVKSPVLYLNTGREGIGQGNSNLRSMQES